MRPLKSILIAFLSFSILQDSLASEGVGKSYSPPPGPPPLGMVWIPGGTYRPVFTNEIPVEVKGYWMAKEPVTNADFLRFLEANPKWRRSAIQKTFADGAYLEGWKGDLDPSPQTLDAPVIRVSWFAARAYAQWMGARLPTQAEWEIAAAASPTQADGSKDDAFQASILASYLRPFPDVIPPVSGPENFFGVRGLHGGIWEWVEDFNTALVTGESRADSSSLDRSMFCGSGALGASDFRDYPAFMRYALRSSLKGAYTMASMGFRIVRDYEGDDDEAEEGVPECCKGEAPPPPSPHADGSVYALNSLWKDTHGTELSVASFAGKPRVVTMFFSSCAYACPMIVRNLKQLDAMLDEDTIAASGVLMFSFDDRRDSPPVLKRYAEQMKLDPARYTLMQSDAANVRAMAAALGISYRLTTGGDFAHSSQILVLDADGIIRASVDNLNSDLTPLAKALKELTRQKQ